MPENTEMMENFTKITKYLTKFKETLINYVGKNLTSKRSKNKIFPWIPHFRICPMAKNENPEMREVF